MNSKRVIRAGALVGAVAMGAMVLAGPVAEAATVKSAAVASPDGTCSTVVEEATLFLEENGIRVVSTLIPVTVGAAQHALRVFAEEIAADC